VEQLARLDQDQDKNRSLMDNKRDHRFTLV